METLSLDEIRKIQNAIEARAGNLYFRETGALWSRSEGSVRRIYWWKAVEQLYPDGVAETLVDVVLPFGSRSQAEEVKEPTMVTKAAFETRQGDCEIICGNGTYRILMNGESKHGDCTADDVIAYLSNALHNAEYLLKKNGWGS